MDATTIIVLIIALVILMPFIKSSFGIEGFRGGRRFGGRRFGGRGLGRRGYGRRGYRGSGWRRRRWRYPYDYGYYPYKPYYPYQTYYWWNPSTWFY